MIKEWWKVLRSILALGFGISSFILWIGHSDHAALGSLIGMAAMIGGDAYS